MTIRGIKRGSLKGFRLKESIRITIRGIMGFP